MTRLDRLPPEKAETFPPKQNPRRLRDGGLNLRREPVG
jgi:hypothetical protein